MISIGAKLRFRSEAEGGRKVKPKGPTYSTVVRVHGATDFLSMVFQFREMLQDGNIIANAEPLLPSANSNFLLPGVSFEVFEGRRVVAIGEFMSAENAMQLEATAQLELVAQHRQIGEIIKTWARSGHDEEPDFDISTIPRMTLGAQEAAA